MPQFDFQVPHNLSTDEARKRLDGARGKLENEYGAKCRWDGDNLIVERKGLEATVSVEPERVKVDVQLGLLLSAMKGPIRDGISKQLTELLA